MKRKKALSILLATALMASAAGCGGGGGGDASSATAVEMRVQRQVGTVSLTNDKGENVTLLEKMRLNAGLFHIRFEHLPHVVGAYLAEESALNTKAGQAVNGVGR